MNLKLIRSNLKLKKHRYNYKYAFTIDLIRAKKAGLLAEVDKLNDEIIKFSTGPGTLDAM